MAAGFDLEQVQDAVAAMIQDGTGITWAYDDTAGLLVPTVTGGGGGLATVATDTTLDGDGSAGDPLSVAEAYTAFERSQARQRRERRDPEHDRGTARPCRRDGGGEPHLR